MIELISVARRRKQAALVVPITTPTRCILQSRANWYRFYQGGEYKAKDYVRVRKKPTFAIGPGMR